MAQIPRAKVKPEVLTWLRKTSGLSADEAARAISTNQENLLAWESGDHRPSMPQLRKLAKAYKRPISYFYLPGRVDEPAVPHDFRRLPDTGDRSYSPALRYEIRTAYRRRSLALDLAEEMGTEVQPIGAFGTTTIDDDPEEVAVRMRDFIRVTYEVQAKWRQPRVSYNSWRQRIEALGVLVFQVTTVDIQQMLGFSLAYAELPVIAINRKNSLNGRTFTMLHEFVHLLLGYGGVCDIEEELPRDPRDQQVEVFCNRTAGAALVPMRQLLAHGRVQAAKRQPQEWDDEAIGALARDFGCSEHVILRRLLISELTTREFYTLKAAEYSERYARLEERNRTKNRNSFGRNMAREAASNLSSFARLVIDSYHAENINLAEASKYLGVRAERVATIEEMLR